MWNWLAKLQAARRPCTAIPVTVYTRQGCHLCEDAREMLVRYGLSPQMVDIDANPELQKRYTTCVPVVVIDGRERFRGRVNEVLLRRLLRGMRNR